MQIDDKAEKLIDFFKRNKCAVAFSGGTDSAYLVYAAKKAGGNFKAYYVKSAFQPQFECDDAERIIRDTGAEMEIINVDILSDGNVISNQGDRCYYCKRKIFGAVIDAARKDGYDLILDGTNASDDLSERPGAKALAEFSVRSPLREVGLTKTEIRKLSKDAGLFTADKPSYSCLATRVKTGETITAEKLQKIEKAENYLFGLGYSDFRVRYAGGSVALEISAKQADKITAEFDVVKKELEKIFDSVTLKKEFRV